MQVFILTNLARIDERLLTTKLLLRCNRESYMHYPNHINGSWLKKMMRKLEDSLLNTGSYEAISINWKEQEEVVCPDDREEEAVSIEKLQHHIKQLTQTQARMEAMLQKLMENQGLECDN